jgi:uncharacterized protein (DUF1501 family)
VTINSQQNSLRECGCPEFNLSRRGFLGGVTAAAGAFTSAGLFGEAFRQVSYGANPDGKVMIVLSLRGGCDGLSMIVPTGAADQAVMQSVRPDIMVPTNRLVAGGNGFGLHPALEPLVPMWNSGKFGAVQSAGLAEPNYSHFEAMEVVERANPGATNRQGWINRMVGINGSSNPEEMVQLGSSMLPTQLIGSAPALGSYALSGMRLADLWNDAQLNAAHAKAWGSTKKKTVMHDGVGVALTAVNKLKPAAETDMGPILPEFPEGPLQSVMANTAVLIKSDLGAKVITIDYGDWDMHAGQGRPEPGQWLWDHLDHFAKSIVAFYDYLGPDWADKVTIVTVSEFGRTLKQNGDVGSDHGYGGVMMLFGAGVSGGTVHGNWPGLADPDLLNGDLRVDNDYRSVMWEVMNSCFPQTGLANQATTVFPGFSPQTIGCMT